MKSEARNPKAEGSLKAEGRSPKLDLRMPKGAAMQEEPMADERKQKKLARRR